MHSRFTGPASDSLVFSVDDEQETVRVGKALAGLLEPGMVVALIGHLGAGKTRLVRAVAEGTGVDPRLVNSPTFVLVQEYSGRWPIYHFDTYRLHNADEFLDLGAEEYMQAGGVCFIEWADRVVTTLPADTLQIEIRITGDSSREFRFTATGPTGDRVLAGLAAIAQSTGL